MYIGEKHQNLLKSLITKKIKSIYAEIQKDDPQANKKYILRVARLILMSHLKGIYGFTKYNEIKKADYFKIIEYIENYVYQYTNSKWYGWAPIIDYVPLEEVQELNNNNILAI